MKLVIPLTISVIIHLLLLLLISQHYQRPKLEQSVLTEKIIQAEIIFTPAPQPATPQATKKAADVQVPETKLAKPQQQEAKTEKIASSTPQPTPQQQQQQHNNQTKTADIPNATFNPYAGLDQLIDEQTQEFISNNPFSDKPNIQSINSVNPKQGQSEIKAIFETAVRIDSDTRVVNYNGQCVQIKRELDFNGFSHFKWTGTSLDCGAGDKMKAQLKESLAKFINPKKQPRNK